MIFALHQATFNVEDAWRQAAAKAATVAYMSTIFQCPFLESGVTEFLGAAETRLLRSVFD